MLAEAGDLGELAWAAADRHCKARNNAIAAATRFGKSDFFNFFLRPQAIVLHAVFISIAVKITVKAVQSCR